VSLADNVSIKKRRKKKNIDITTHTVPGALPWQRRVLKKSMILLLKST
jgi:hypothetical protein